MSHRLYLHLVGVCLLRAVQSPRHPLQLLCAVLAGLHMRLDHTLDYTLYADRKRGQLCRQAASKSQTAQQRAVRGGCCLY